jgi:hypothetical protein
MHSYLAAIGFSNLKKEDLENILYQTVRNSSSYQMAFDSEGNSMVEMRLQVCENAGLALRGYYDAEGNFKLDYYFPYLVNQEADTDFEMEIIKQSDKECYQGLCDEMGLGVNLIFYLQNMMDYLQKCRNKKVFYDENSRKIAFGGLSLDGKILLPVAEPKFSNGPKRSKADHSDLIAAAREGDEEAIETLTLEDMDMYSKISQRINNEDIYSIVTTSFMPYGIESDKYSVIGNICDVKKRVNVYSGEELCIMKLSANDIIFDVCINRKNLLGEPQVGRRFKGNVWLQGNVVF